MYGCWVSSWWYRQYTVYVCLASDSSAINPDCNSEHELCNRNSLAPKIEALIREIIVEYAPKPYSKNQGPDSNRLSLNSRSSAEGKRFHVAQLAAPWRSGGEAPPHCH